MPQYGRRKPISTKQRKGQLLKKREVHRAREEEEYAKSDVVAATAEMSLDTGEHSRSDSGEEQEKTDDNAQLAADKLVNKMEKKLEIGNAARSTVHRQDRYKLMFAHEQAVEIEERKRKARQVVGVLPEELLEVSFDDVYGSTEHIDMPCRPEWNYGSSKQSVEATEQRYFNGYVDKLMESTHDQPLSYFEMNLETWRQLWRVLEMSDVVVVIADARHPILHFPPSLYRHVVDTLKKTLVLVLNKIDLVPASLVLAWREYFYSLFPNLHVVLYTAKPGHLSGNERTDAKGLMSHHRSGTKLRMICVGGARQLIRALAQVCTDSSVLSEWSQKLADFNLPDGDVEEFHTSSAADSDEKSARLTIGLVGHPNVGKSSLLNSLIGKKVVSCSRTPGHTKHFQTYFLTPHIQLCDCPGLVFPSRVDKQLQILSGMYPIAQVREPYTTIGYLASLLGAKFLYRIGLVSEASDMHIMKNGSEGEASAQPKFLEAGGRLWSAWDICEEWAVERGYRTAKGARPDVYRAANHILRLATDGRISVLVRPPKYSERLSEWQCHADLESVVSIQREGLDNASQKLDERQLLEGNSSDATSSDSSSSDEAVGQSVASSNPFGLLDNDDSD